MTDSLKDRTAAVLLGAATAATVVWQNARLTVLWDLSYILENATRVAAGDVPYRDFPFPYAPLTFATQALIIRLFGHAAWHHTLYAVAAAALATALTYFLARRLVSRPHAILLTAPLSLLGIYCIFPHPFYDPDACLVVLALLLLLLRGASRGGSVALGAACVVPLFVKQNIGLAFLAAVAGCVALLWLIDRRQPADERVEAPWLLMGMTAGAVAAIILVSTLFGIDHYYRWTIRFAAARRLPPLSQQLAIFDDSTLWWWLAVVVAGAVVLRLGRLRVIGAALVATPWVWSVVRVFDTDDPVEPEINFLRLWPLMIVIGLLLAVAAWREERGVVRILPLLLVATILGTFLSQSTWGSTYAIWPLLVLLLALLVRYTRAPVWLAGVIAAVMLFSAWDYVSGNERLTYVKLDGPMHRSSIPALSGLSMRGEWLPGFEELVAYAQREIPPDAAILSLPGEDLFYFATGRRPAFPVLMFDRTVNPYDAATIVRLVTERRVRWLIVKKRLQLNGTPMTNRDEVLQLLAPRLEPAASLSNYQIYRIR